MDKPNIAIDVMIKVMQELKTCKYDGKNKLVWVVESTNSTDKINHAKSLINQLK